MINLGDFNDHPPQSLQPPGMHLFLIDVQCSWSQPFWTSLWRSRRNCRISSGTWTLWTSRRPRSKTGCPFWGPQFPASSNLLKAQADFLHAPREQINGVSFETVQVVSLFRRLMSKQERSHGILSGTRTFVSCVIGVSKN